MQNILNLQIFAEGAEDSSLAMNTADASSADTIGSSGVATTSTPDGGTDVSNPAEMGTESFDELINGRYKSEYDNAVKAKVKDAISKRFKNQEDLKGRLDALNPLVMQMASKYGLDPENVDVSALTKAIENDNSLYEEEAFNRGMDVDTLKQIKSLERENAKLKATEDKRIKEDESRRRFQELVDAGEALKQIYPSFNLDDEMMNESFGRLLANNVPMQTAYEVIHKDEILSNGMAYAVQKTAANLSNAIASGQRRVAENGMTGAATASAGQLDPSKLTAKDFAQLKARAERGEKIYFN